MANSNVSEEAKEHSRQVLEEMEGPGKLPGQQSVDEGKNVGNVIDGHKVRIRCKNLARVFVDVHPGHIEEPQHLAGGEGEFQASPGRNGYLTA